MAVLRLVPVGIDRKLLDSLYGWRIRRDPTLRERAAGVSRDAVERCAISRYLAAANAETVIPAKVLGVWRERRQVERRSYGPVDHQRKIVDQLVLKRNTV